MKGKNQAIYACIRIGTISQIAQWAFKLSYYGFGLKIGTL